MVWFIDENCYEERGGITSPVADLLTDRHTADGCRIRTHLTQFTGLLQVSVHHSSEELKPHLHFSFNFSQLSKSKWSKTIYLA